MATLNPSTFTLRLATPAEKLACWRTNSVSWAGKLSPSDYVLRETALGNCTLTRDGGVQYWVFVGPGSESVEDVIYAAVESIRKPVVVKTREGGFSEEWSYGIASVFTPEQWRRRGFARWMMRRLGERFDGEEAGYRFSVLYSDVGEYYSPLGWPAFPSLETILPPSASASSPETTPITTATLPALCERDISVLTSYVRNAPLTPDIHTRLTFLPTYAQAEWHFSAEDLIASKLFTSPPRSPTTKGAISTSGETWGYWVHDYNEDKLIFLRLVSLYPSSPTAEEEEKAVLETAAILRAARTEAASWDLRKVVLWNPDTRTLAACKLVLGDGKEPEVRTRTEGSIPSLRWKGGEGKVEKGIEWVASEKFGWC
ncbi:MAG: hypothetical protein M1839_006237 [Geoglossum umbratile]|nr:MAG: hypothetical protein M1839_006237 [Geoglossum umbratile]